MRSGDAKADALASTDRDRSNTSLAAVSSCESRTPTATGAPVSPKPGSGDAASTKRARAASRPTRAIPPPLALSRYRANAGAAQSSGASIGRARSGRPKMRPLKSLRRVNDVTGKSQTGKELANPRRGAYLWRVANSDRVHVAGSLFD